jgi:DNA-binding NtrC family response regulator
VHKLDDDDEEFPQDETKRIERVQHARAMPSRLRLVVMLGERGNATYPLPLKGEILIGRSLGCHIRIDNAKISRKHAILRIGPKIEVVDLGSANGTRIGDRHLSPNEPALVAPGEMMVFGSTMAVVQVASQSTRIRSLLTHSHFEARLEDECAAASASGKVGFAVVRVLAGEKQAGSLDSTFEQWLRPMDVVGAYSPNELEFLLVDVDAEQAKQLVERARPHLERVAGPVEIGLATYPAAGRTPQKLIAAAGRFRATVENASLPVQSGFLERVRPLIERVASGTISVLITGETGAGKEVLAYTVHRASPRAHLPMLCLNCAAFSETLLESELFGHERGAFTGATQTKPGLIESADGSTVFLDEIGEMPASLQVKLLRVIQERQVQRVGGLKPRTVNVRFVSATNRDLEADVVRGTFRQDLYYRLNGVVLAVPPLRERTDEIEPLAQAFIAQCAEQLGVRSPTLSPEVLELLQQYAWPGNVRELRNVIERAILLCTGSVITLDHVPRERMQRGDTLVTQKVQSPISSSPGPSSTRPIGAESPTMVGIRPTADRASERARVVAALESCAGNQTQAAKLLGISRNTLIARLDQYELARPRKRGD